MQWIYRCGWVLVGLLLVAHLLVIDGRAPTWEDEVFAVSTAWSIAQGGPAKLSVLAQYPKSLSPERFYGPVSFETEAELLRLLGLGTWPWRALCTLVGELLLLTASYYLLRLLNTNRWIRLSCVATVAACSLFCSFLPGRWDTMTVGLCLAGIALLFYATNARRLRLAGLATSAGVAFALAMGSTPRALPLLAAVALGHVVALIVVKESRVQFAAAGMVAFVTTFLADWALLAPLGLSPWSWLDFVRSASKGDSINSSPLLGGAWNVGLSSHKVVFATTILLVVTGLFALVGSRHRTRQHISPWKISITVTAVANATVTGLMASRFFAGAIFWLPLLAVAIYAWVDWEAVRTTRLKPALITLVALAFLLPCLSETEHLRDAFSLWRSREPDLLLKEVRLSIPSHSIVYGPVGGYFFAVEQSGSRYLYPEEHTTPGLSSRADSPAHKAHDLDLAACSGQAFVIWPREGSGSVLPPEIEHYPKVRVDEAERGSYEKRPTGVVIYKLQKPQHCPAAVGGLQ